jgi:hypothetical protein
MVWQLGIAHCMAESGALVEDMHLMQCIMPTRLEQCVLISALTVRLLRRCEECMCGIVKPLRHTCL